MNDCHRASGMGDSKKPSEWLRNNQTTQLITEISQSGNTLFDRKQTFFKEIINPVNVIKGGNNSGTYAVKELVYAYAMWISPSFNLKVIRAYDDLCIDQNNEITVEHKDILNQNIIPFTFENTKVRVINRDGEAWFVANDVASVLGYLKPRNAIFAHYKSAISIGALNQGSLDPQTKIIPERDVYRLVMRSKLPSAEQFEEKVVGEILPSIRKTGGYMTTIPNETPEQILSKSSSFNN